MVRSYGYGLLVTEPESSSQNPTHKYDSSGSYAISLTVYDSEGRSSIAKTTITIVMNEDFPIERTDEGWNIYISDDLTLSTPAIAILAIGIWLLLSSIWSIMLPISNPKVKRIIGLILIVIGAYFFIVEV